MSRRDVLLKALASAPPDVRRMTQGVDPDDARRRPALEHWSLADVVSHLVDIEKRYRAQMQRVVAEAHPVWRYLHPAEATHDLQTPLDALTEQFQVARAETLAFLEGLPAGIWQRKVQHETVGEISVRFLVQRWVEHDTAHLSQLASVRHWLRTGILSNLHAAPTGYETSPILNDEVKNEQPRTRRNPRARRRD